MSRNNQRWPRLLLRTRVNLAFTHTSIACEKINMSCLQETSYSCFFPWQLYYCFMGIWWYLDLFRKRATANDRLFSGIAPSFWRQMQWPFTSCKSALKLWNCRLPFISTFDWEGAFPTRLQTRLCGDGEWCPNARYRFCSTLAEVFCAMLHVLMHCSRSF